jgi:hypothetical protein
MTMNEPGRNPPRYEGQSHHAGTHSRDNTTWAWVIGALAALAILGGIFYAMSDRGDSVATNQPAATSGAGPTAGQGSNQPTTPPAQSAPGNR